MNNKYIWIVDDERELSDIIKKNLSKRGYITECFVCGEEILQNIQNKKPNLIILDLMLPGINGVEICKIIKREPKTCNIPIIILTARCHEMDVINGFEAGADDYITKPFNTRILEARIKSIFDREERIKGVQNPIVRTKGITINPNCHEVLVDNKNVVLTISEIKVLYLLAEKSGRVFSRYQIVEAIRRDDYLVNDRSIDVLLGRLRKKLGVYGKYIETIYGVGYRFNESI